MYERPAEWDAARSAGLEAPVCRRRRSCCCCCCCSLSSSSWLSSCDAAAFSAGHLASSIRCCFSSRKASTSVSPDSGERSCSSSCFWYWCVRGSRPMSSVVAVVPVSSVFCDMLALSTDRRRRLLQPLPPAAFTDVDDGPGAVASLVASLPPPDALVRIGLRKQMRGDVRVETSCRRSVEDDCSVLPAAAAASTVGDFCFFCFDDDCDIPPTYDYRLLARCFVRPFSYTWVAPHERHTDAGDDCNAAAAAGAVFVPLHQHAACSRCAVNQPDRLLPCDVSYFCAQSVTTRVLYVDRSIVLDGTGRCPPLGSAVTTTGHSSHAIWPTNVHSYLLGQKWHIFGIWVSSLASCTIFAIAVYSRIIFINWRRSSSADINKFCFYANKL